MRVKRIFLFFTAACVLGLMGLALQFTPVAAATPILHLLSSSGTVGSTVGIQGSNFNTTAGTAIIYFSGVPVANSVTVTGGISAQPL